MEPWTIEVKAEKELASSEATLGPLGTSRLPLSENPDHHPETITVQPEDAFEDTTFKLGFDIVTF
jgi:hypothetical protein